MIFSVPDIVTVELPIISLEDMAIISDLEKKAPINENDDKDVAHKAKGTLTFVRRFVSTVCMKSGACAGAVVGLNTGLCDSMLHYIRSSMRAYT